MTSPVLNDGLAPRPTPPSPSNQRGVGRSLIRRAIERALPFDIRDLPPPKGGLFVVPSRSKLQQIGNGSALKGLAAIAIKNPIYRIALRFVPSRYRTAAAVGCGCATGCGCASGCAGLPCSSCLLPLLLIVLAVVLGATFVSRQPGFIAPLFCERTRAAFCDPSSISLNIDLADVPPDAIDTYRAVESETGVPWFYLAAWEKAATDFGRLDFSDQGGTAIPGQALDAAYASLDATIDGIAESDGGADNLDAIRLELRTERDDAIKRLSSQLRGGSFGLFLVTAEEYRRYGQRPDGTWRDPWSRKDAATIVALHLVDLFPTLAQRGELTYYGTPAIEPVDPVVKDWIRTTLMAAAQNGDTATWAEFEKIIGRYIPPPPKNPRDPRPSLTPDPNATPAPLAERWFDGPRQDQPITPTERYVVCTLMLPEADLAVGACDAFRAGSASVAVAPGDSLADVVRRYYDPAADVLVAGKGIADADWPSLQIVFGALLSDPSIWGGDETADYIVPALTETGGLSNATERVNAYAQAINLYARSVYRAWVEAQAALRTNTAAWRAEQAALAFWMPPVETVAAELKIKPAYLLATLKADGAFGCQAGVGSAAPSDAVYDFLSDSATRVGRAMADELDFAGETWLALAVQVQWETGGQIRGNNPLNLTDDGGYAQGVLTWAAYGQIGWYEGGSATERHHFAAFATLEGGARANAANYRIQAERGLYGYDRVLAAGQAGDLLGVARAIEASSWSSDHYGSDPSADPPKDGKIVRSIFGILASAIGGCYRFGPGLAVEYIPQKAAPSDLVIAMNFCIPTMTDCGTATITAGDRSVTARVIEFWPTDLGTPNERIAGLSPGVVDALGLDRANTPWAVSIQLHPPVGGTLPTVVTEPDPLTAVRKLATELRTAAGLADGVEATMGDLIEPWRLHSACTPDPIQTTSVVVDPYDSTTTYTVTPWCDYLARVTTAATIYAATSGGSVATIFGVQPVSRYGFIWPIVGARLTSGFEPRAFRTLLRIRLSPSGPTYDVHDGLDLSPPGCDGEVVATKAGWLYQVQGTAFIVRDGVDMTIPTTLVYIDHQDGTRSIYGHVEGALDPALAAEMATTTTTRNGHRTIWVEAGTRITSIDQIACHLHFEIEIPQISLPATDTFANAPAVYTNNGGTNTLRIDPLRVLPQVPSMLRPRSNGQILPPWYLSTYGGFPPPSVPAIVGIH